MTPHFSARRLAQIRNKMGENIPVPPARKRDNEESRIQQAFMLWWNAEHRVFNVPRELVFAIPNGGHRSGATGAIMKREGVRSGVPDVLVAIPTKHSPGLWIEFKTATGTVSDNQRSMMRALESAGYQTAVCRTTEQAIVATKIYLGRI